MAFASFGDTKEESLMNEINMIPFIDIMLVLLIIFIVTAPLLTHAVKIDLPKISTTPNITKSEKIEIAVKTNGEILINGAQVDKDKIGGLLKEFAPNNPEVHIRADKESKYDNVAFVTAQISRAGITKIAFVTEP